MTGTVCGCPRGCSV